VGDFLGGNSGQMYRASYVFSGAFSMVAVPEASTWAMMLVGLLGVSALARRQRQA
jgi:hypothetical protein